MCFATVWDLKYIRFLPRFCTLHTPFLVWSCLHQAPHRASGVPGLGCIPLQRGSPPNTLLHARLDFSHELQTESQALIFRFRHFHLSLLSVQGLQTSQKAGTLMAFLQQAPVVVNAQTTSISSL